MKEVKILLIIKNVSLELAEKIQETIKKYNEEKAKQ